MSAKKKICFLTHNIRQDNGAGVFSMRLIHGLHDFDALILTHDEIFPIRRFIKKLKDIKQCDFIHALDAYPYGIVAVLAGFLLGKKVIITAVGTGAINRLYHPFYSIFLKWAYRNASRVVAISNFTKMEILRKVPELKIDVINHGVDFEKFQHVDVLKANELLRFSRSPSVLAQDGDAALSAQSGTVPAPRAKPVQQLIGFSLTKPYILSVGSLRWRKGYHRSIQAFVEVSKIFPELKYVIAGKRYKDDYYGRLQKLITDLKLEGRVVILDNIDDEGELILLYKNAELFCLEVQTANRDMEGFGLVFLEAAAAGLPVVGTSGSGVEDAVFGGPLAGWAGKNGILIDDPRDSKVFAEAIIKILSDTKIKNDMSQKSLDFAKRSSWESKIAEYKNIYRVLNI